MDVTEQIQNMELAAAADELSEPDPGLPEDSCRMSLPQLHDLQTRMDTYRYLDLNSLVFDLEDTDFDALDFMDGNEMSEQTVAVEPNYPVGPSYVGECEICFDTTTLQNRLCCGLPVCDNCMEHYLEVEVSQGNVKIACISGSCGAYLFRDEILGRLPDSHKDKYYKFLVDVNQDPKVKTCPRCSHIYNVEKHASQNQGKYGVSVTCPECRLLWCFECQAPWHSGVKCKDYKKGDKLLKLWAKEHHYGSSNAQRCPKCKIFIQRNGGCDHMMCSKCNTNFCYRCGERYLNFKFFGDHNTRSSVFGCKYIYKPEKPVVRRVVRGSVLGVKLLGGLGLLGLGIAAAGVLLGASVVLLPAYGTYKLMKRRKFLRKIRLEQAFWESQLQAEYMVLQRQRVVHENFLLRQPADEADSGIHVGIQTDQAQQVLVTVHNHDPTNAPPASGYSPDPSSEVQIDIQDSRGTVTVTTAEVSHQPLGPDGSDAPVVLHVRTSYKTADPVDNVNAGESANNEKNVASESVSENPALDVQGPSETDVVTGVNTSSKHGGSVRKHSVLCSKSSNDSEKMSKGEKMGSMRRMKIKQVSVTQTDESSGLLKKNSSKKLEGSGSMSRKLEGTGSLSRKKKKFSVSSDAGLQVTPAVGEPEGQGETVLDRVEGEDGSKTGDDLSPKELTHPQGCFLKLFSKNLKTLQHQFDKEKEKQAVLKLSPDNKEHVKELDLHDCPDIVSCAIEAEMRNKEETEVTGKREDIDLVQGTLPEGSCCTHF